MLKFISSGEGIPPAAGPYSPGVVVGGQCFLSGQIGLDPDTGTLVAHSLAAEVEQAIRNLFAVAAAGGFTPHDIALIFLLLTDVSRFEEVNSTYMSLLPAGHMPARMTFEVSALPLGARVEVQGFAVKSNE